jgi:hypothetical protein
LTATSEGKANTDVGKAIASTQKKTQHFTQRGSRDIDPAAPNIRIKFILSRKPAKPSLRGMTFTAATPCHFSEVRLNAKQNQPGTKEKTIKK